MPVQFCETADGYLGPHCYALVLANAAARCGRMTGILLPAQFGPNEQCWLGHVQRALSARSAIVPVSHASRVAGEIRASPDEGTIEV